MQLGQTTLFGSGIGIGAHCTLRAVTSPDDRERTLRTLIELAAGNNPTDCWDDRRALELLRSQTTADELRSMGVAADMIDEIFPPS